MTAAYTVADNAKETAAVSDTDKTNTNTPKTGDSNDILLWISLLAVSAAAVAGTAAYRRRKYNN